MILPASAVKGPLAEAFNAFMATADRMEASYSQLQGEVARLRRELEERNAALTSEPGGKQEHSDRAQAHS